MKGISALIKGTPENSFVLAFFLSYENTTGSRQSANGEGALPKLNHVVTQSVALCYSSLN